MLTPSTATSCDMCRKFVTHGTLLALGRVTATVALAFTLVGLLPATTYAQNPNCFDLISGPFVIQTFNACNAEPITIDAQVRLIYCTKNDASGGQHVTIRWFHHGQGEATNPITDKKYSYNSEQVDEGQFPSNGTGEITNVFNWVVIRQGEDRVLTGAFGDDDFLLKTTMHTKFAPNTPPVLQVQNVHTSCP